MPDYLSARTLSEHEARKVRESCIRQLHEAGDITKKAIATIDEFAAFCKLLSQPENHILVPSKQYVEKQVPTRHEQDMVNHRARELLELPKYTAYAKVLQEVDGQQRVWKGKIQTLKRKETTDNFYLQKAAESNRIIIDLLSRKILGDASG